MSLFIFQLGSGRGPAQPEGVYAGMDVYECVFLDGLNVHSCMVICETCLWACVYMYVQTQDLCMNTYLDMGY